MREKGKKKWKFYDYVVVFRNEVNVQMLASDCGPAHPPSSLLNPLALINSRSNRLPSS